MLEINPNTLYSLSDLNDLLAPLGISAEAFLERLRPRKIFRTVWYGQDLLVALDQAPELKRRPRATRRTRALPAQGKPATRARAAPSKPLETPSGVTVADVKDVCAAFGLKKAPRIPGARKA